MIKMWTELYGWNIVGMCLCPASNTNYRRCCTFKCVLQMPEWICTHTWTLLHK